MKDGSKKEVRENNLFVAIDGTGYKAKYKPLESLNSYANRLLEENFGCLQIDSPGLAVYS